MTVARGAVPPDRGPAPVGPVPVAVLLWPGVEPGWRGLRTPAVTDRDALAAALPGWGEAVGAAVEVLTVPPDPGGPPAPPARGGGLVVVTGGRSWPPDGLAELLAGTGGRVVVVHLDELPHEKAAAPWGAGTRLVHGRGLDGIRDAVAHLVAEQRVPSTTHRHGPLPDQLLDLRVPEGHGPSPVAVLVHGGFWYAPWERDLLDPLAVALHARGWATANVEYRRVGAGGGWPATLDDVLAAVGHLGDLARDRPLDLDRVVLVGHSAGGHLALLAAARWRAAGLPGRLRRVVGLAPVADLAAAAAAGLGGGAVPAFLGPHRLVDADPLAHLPLGVPAVLVHCADDRLVPVTQSRAWAAAARAAGDDVTLLEPTAGGHFAVVDPDGEVGEQVLAAVTAG